MTVLRGIGFRHCQKPLHEVISKGRQLPRITGRGRGDRPQLIDRETLKDPGEGEHREPAVDAWRIPDGTGEVTAVTEQRADVDEVTQLGAPEENGQLGHEDVVGRVKGGTMSASISRMRPCSADRRPEPTTV